MIEPEKITVNNAGVGGTGSDYGSMRLESDVLAYCPDVVFVEFTLNDQAGVIQKSMPINVESIIRQCANADHIPVVIFIHIPDRRTSKTGEYSLQKNITAYNTILTHYGLTAINAHQLVLDDIAQNNASWDDYVRNGNVHPTESQGAKIADIMYAEFSSQTGKYIKKIEIPIQKLNSGTPDNSSAQPVSPFFTICDENWEFDPVMRDIVTEGYGEPILNPFSDYLSSSVSGATLSFTFRGTRVMVNGLTGEQGRECTYVITDSAGNIERKGTTDNYLANYKWYEEPVLREYGLSDTEHILTLTVSEDAEADAAGKMFGIGEIWVDEK